MGTGKACTLGPPSPSLLSSGPAPSSRARPPASCPRECAWALPPPHRMGQLRRAGQHHQHRHVYCHCARTSGRCSVDGHAKRNGRGGGRANRIDRGGGHAKRNGCG
eukprot:2785523-Pleurochrysis_carterae.AAC.1